LPLIEFRGRLPRVHPDAFVAPTATLIGEVEVGPGASIWFGAVLRADMAPIRIGEGSNVQDNAVIHVAQDLPTEVGRNVTIGHGAVMEGCVLEEGSLAGMGSILLQRSRLGAGSILAAGGVLAEGAEVPAGHLAAGVPAKVKRALTEGQAGRLAGAAAHYRGLRHEYRE
jgi:carbonic anhydrase/acetyltransferase-like protein (isoleucine patch superfamily)